MDCRNIEFSPARAQQRIEKALVLWPKPLLHKLIAFVLYLLGAQLKQISSLLDISEESIRTYARVVSRSGVDALQDRRHTHPPQVQPAPQHTPSHTSLRVEDGFLIFSFDSLSGELRIPEHHKLQARTVLLSLLHSEIVSEQDVASALELHPRTCRQLADELKHNDVDLVLLDKRQGQTQDYRVGSAQKAEIIKHYAARAVVGHSTSSDKIAEAINAQFEIKVSPRTVRWHIAKLGLAMLKHSLPDLVDTLKKNSST